ncbi:MAG: F0F1 ATP synthase subunit delta [Endomicrobium sp.]|jgi:F-type H+-transporting ATPase subunit delta|nr:F0F1 ATP synthase subunit delta [Endomicrobium sp.]
MKRELIKELARSTAEYGEMSDEELNWLFARLSKKDLKLFINLLFWEIKNKKINVNYAGLMTRDYEEKINASFPNRRAEFKEDPSLIAGVKFEYGDNILDYSVSGMINKILGNIKENL